MEKQRHYEINKIEICRNCGGAGCVNPQVEGSWLLRRLQCPDRRVPCDVCNGTGRIDKHTEINITIKPYYGTEEKQ